MNELEQTLIGDSAAAPPAHILEDLSEELVHAATPGAPHTVYQELWHVAFWQQITLDWIAGVETPCPERAALGFPTEAQVAGEPWEKLRRRFLEGAPGRGHRRRRATTRAADTVPVFCGQTHPHHDRPRAA